MFENQVYFGEGAPWTSCASCEMWQELFSKHNFHLGFYLKYTNMYCCKRKLHGLYTTVG